MFNAWGIGINLCTKLWWLSEFIPFAEMWSSWHCRHAFRSYSHSFVGIDNTSIFGLVSPNNAAGFSTAFTDVLQSIAAGIGISNFLRAFLMVCLKSSSSGSMRKILRNFLALSSFGFSIANVCFALRFDASYICFHISGHTLSGLEVVCFLVSLLTRPCITHQVAFRSITWILWSLSMHQIILFHHLRSSNLQSVFPTLRRVMYMLFW